MTLLAYTKAVGRLFLSITISNAASYLRHKPWQVRRKQFHFGEAERNIHCDAAICAACMNINIILSGGGGGGGSGPPAPLVPTPIPT